MNKAILRTKGFIGVTLAAVLILGGVKVQNLMAAERINPQETNTITAKIAEDSVFAKEFDNRLDIKLYKIAGMDETGKLVEAEGFENINREYLNERHDPQDIKKEIVEPALTIVEAADEMDAIILSIDRGQGETSGTVEMDGPGVYLYVPYIAADQEDPRYTYTFTSYIISAPTSNYIMTGTGDDDWIYNVSFELKSEAEARYGSLEIVKTLDTFNSSLGDAAFVYEVKAVLAEEEEVLNNVYSIDFSAAGTKSIVIEDIPATSVVTVTEVYTGASYESVGNQVISGNEIIPNETTVVKFENDYDGRLISGGISAENNFEIEDGTIYWIDRDGNPVEQGTINIPVYEEVAQ